MADPAHVTSENVKSAEGIEANVGGVDSVEANNEQKVVGSRPKPTGRTNSTASGRWGEPDREAEYEPSQIKTDIADLRREFSRDGDIPEEDESRYIDGQIQTSSSSSSDQSDDMTRIETRDLTDKHLDSSAEDFSLDNWLRRYRQLSREHGHHKKRTGVSFRGLTVKGINANATFVRTFPDALVGTFGPNQWNFLTHFLPFLKFGKKPPVRDLIKDFNGTIKDGEMLLVLGRPGSGCSTLLRTIANQRGNFMGVEGDVNYGGLTPETIAKYYRSEIIYNSEDDIHFPHLTVDETLNFALQTKAPRKRIAGETKAQYVDRVKQAILRTLGINHVKGTNVGNEYVRGVSGGERKRVSIAEVMSTRSVITCWDNSTRGLDASTAVDFVRALRVLTDVGDVTTVATLYQAGERLYNEFDKVCLIEEGRQLYFGPVQQAQPYFESIGFARPPRQTTADFLTSIALPTERHVREGWEKKIPRTAVELEAAFRKSDIYRDNLEEIEDFNKSASGDDRGKELKEAVRQEKGKKHKDGGNYTISFPKQVLQCTKRQFQIVKGDRGTYYTKTFTNVGISLLVGSLFYNQPFDTTGNFTRGGSLFIAVLFLGWLQLAELGPALEGRPITTRHRQFAFYRPSALAIARVITDVPMLLFQSTVFCIITYFMFNLDRTPSKFFIYFLFVITSSINLTSLYRVIAGVSPTFNEAIRYCGLVLNVLILTTGYLIPSPQLLGMQVWVGWIRWANPLAYVFEAVISNEFYNRQIACNPTNIVPFGPTYNNPMYQTCTTIGSVPGALTVNGASYIEQSFSYSRDHLWRNFGIVLGFTALYIFLGALASELFDFSPNGAGITIFRKTKASKKRAADMAKPQDEENNGDFSDLKAVKTEEELDAPVEGVVKSESIFTWENIDYSVPVPGGERQLLHDVSGYVVPGKMTALMGASGAGKTTLLNTLAQRKKAGVVTGKMLVDGSSLGIEFQRGTGFCEQMDIHDGTQTVREALEFSALLRQRRERPRAEKLAYVDTIVELLDLTSLQDAIIGVPGAGLDTEQRKRLTIGVELVAKPPLLLFLDEPTSGLDAEGAFNIIRFMRRLARSGQAILCTIHQPSSQLFEMFDNLLLLDRGGRTAYFGPLGSQGNQVLDYFSERGAPADESVNIAEHILETLQKNGMAQGHDWPKMWNESSNKKKILEDIDQMKRSRTEAVSKSEKTELNYEYAATTAEQTRLVTIRMFKNYWRDPNYLYGKVFISVSVGILIGFTFYKVGHNQVVSQIGLQDTMFAAFSILFIPPLWVNGVLPKLFTSRMLWQAREDQSKTYNWVAFVTASVVAEWPMCLLCGTLYWAIQYNLNFLPSAPSHRGYAWIMNVIAHVFFSCWGQFVVMASPSIGTCLNILPFAFILVNIYNGIVVPQPSAYVNAAYRNFVYYINPSTYYLRGVIANAIGDFTTVQCQASELVSFPIAPGFATCQAYLTDFFNSPQGTGYLENPNAATGLCNYCQYRNGVTFLQSINVPYGNGWRWRSMGIFIGFVLFSIFLVYFFTYTVAVKGWLRYLDIFAFTQKQSSKLKTRFRKPKNQAAESTSEEKNAQT